MSTSKYNIQKIITRLLLSLFMVSFVQNEPKLDLLEKVYAQTDRPLYFPDETVWFKAYVVNSSNTISAISEMMYVDLLSPKGSVVQTLRLPVSNGYAYGNLKINKDWVGGIYTLKMYTNWMRNYGKDHFFTKELTVQKIIQPNLLMKLKFEKEGYGQGADVTANFEVYDLKNNPLVGSDISMAVMIDGKSFLKQKLTTDSEGKLAPKFKLPENIEITDVLLNLLIPYMGSTESISRSVPVILDNLDVQFFPESGKIIAGTTNTVAFKAVNEFGKPADISGELVDESGNIILDFKSLHDGMGGFDFSPIATRKYFARVTKPFASKKQIVLPEVHSTGVRFSAEKMENMVRLSLFSNSTEPLQLEVSNSSKVLLSRKIASEESIIEIDTESFPMGITKFSILGEMKAVLAERLVFVNRQEELQIDIQIEKGTFDTREKVVLKVSTKDLKGMPVSSNLSVAVADNKMLSFADDKQDHIVSYLLMSSELRGKIHKPIFYFDNNESKATKALDYVLLTHGWRDYITKPKPSLFNAVFQPEQLAVQHGAVVDLKGKPIKAHLLLFDTYGDKVLDFDTDEKGKFSFKQSDNNRLTMVAYTDSNQAVYIHRKQRDNGLSSAPESKDGIPNPNTPKAFFGVKKPNQRTIKKEAKANLSLEEDSAALDEVVVTAYGSTSKSNATASLVYINSTEIETQENLANILQGKVAGVQITSEEVAAGSGPKINIRGVASLSGNNQPLYVLDGVPMRYDGQREIHTEDITSISVLKDLAATTLYGTQGSNGVILISTKNRSRNNYQKKKLNNAKRNNYTALHFYGSGNNSLDSSAKFYVPVYRGENLPEERTDFRRTIYWNPVVQTNADGEATLEFYNSDAITSYKITAEGIGHNGLLGRQEKDYSTKKMLNLDFKLPAFMTIGDIVTLPITLTNESDENLFAILELDVSENLKLVGTIDTNVTLPAHASIIKNIRVVAQEKGDDLTIRASVKSPQYRDIVYKEVTILSPHFPMQTSISGIDSQMFEFEVDHATPNSLTAEFTMYTDIVGDVMNGVSSMLRQPYGCFEQVSSTTYPNILVLKYLQETGKTKRRIEKRAQKYIADGYRRMAAYETKENGFEWYGNTPPHEALSAYGLMQFKEMTEVYDGVDQEMIQRTVDWLLSRRDTKGGFLQNKGKYGFSSAPADVNNAYIVYALTETKTKTNIEKEYRKAYFDALDSLDTYKLALTALSSNNLKKASDYENLMSYIKLNIRNHGFEKLPVKNTITRSYGSAENLETVAFTILALMRDFDANAPLIHEGVSYLLKRRAYGRFGSTQSTAMALKVLIAYAKFEKKKQIGVDDMVEIHLNGKVLREKVKIDDTGHIKIDSLQKYIKNGKQQVAIRFTNAKASFPYNMNIKWNSSLPNSSENCKVALQTTIVNDTYSVGDVIRMKIAVTNTKKHGLSMPTAVIGIPSGASVQPWQLKEILEQKKVAYYEIFDNYLVLYWREMGPEEVKLINLDLKAEIAGTYTAPASSAYLYYGDEDKQWIAGNPLRIME